MEYFSAIDPNTGRVHYGHDQDWYRHWFKRLAGCGPTTCANILLYNTQAGSLFSDAKKLCSAPFSGSEKIFTAPAELETVDPDIESFPVGISASLKRMELMWRHVTPSKRGGVNSTEKFCEGIRSYCRSLGHEVVIEAMNIPPIKDSRPTPAAAASFISESLHQNRALAFLNLDNGSEKQLEKWHWVTIVGITINGKSYHSEDASRAAETNAAMSYYYENEGEEKPFTSAPYCTAVSSCHVNEGGEKPCRVNEDGEKPAAAVGAGVNGNTQDTDTAAIHTAGNGSPEN